MKKFLPLLLLAFPTASFADITHSIQSVASVSTLGASVTSERLSASISAAGTNITPNDGTSGQIGSLNLSSNGISNGVPVISADTNYTVTNSGDAWSLSETYRQADSTSTTAATVSNGVSTLPLLGSYTLVSGGDPGSVTITMDSGGAMTATVANQGPGTSTILQNTITFGLD